MSSIYSISFSKSSKLYIGQTSKDIYTRLAQHMSKLKYGIHHNKKLQIAYNKDLLGTPSIELIEVCTDRDANDREIYWISLLDTFNSGWNATPGGSQSLPSYLHSCAKHSLDDYLCVITILALTDWTYKDIANETGVSINIIQDIVTKRNHITLRDMLPDLYDLACNKSRVGITNIKEGGWGTWINDTSGEIVVIQNMSKFCKERRLSTSKMTLVNKGERNHHMGWRVHVSSI